MFEARSLSMRPYPRLFAIVVAALWLGSGLGGRAEASIILQTPAGLNPGDHFRFVFVTDGIRNATSTNIAEYDSFVNAQAGGATFDSVVVNWLAIGSTDSIALGWIRHHRDQERAGDSGGMPTCGLCH
jgi:hypothetical protein